MNLFRTPINAGVSIHTFSLTDRILTLGSCFADSIGAQLIRFKSQALPNPFGVIYNPHSIHKALRYSVFNEAPLPGTFLQHQGIHLNYDFHSELSSLHATDLQKNLVDRIGSVHHFLRDTRLVMITYGTAWVYERNDTHEIVANCHKQPSQIFTKSLLTQKKIIESFEGMYRDLKGFNPDIRIILTVSPVRHLKDTLELNSVSKSVLRIACHTLQEVFQGVEYFPAYEMLLDDLRDYRFYKSDMIHPSAEAEEYIWEQFASRYFNNDVRAFMEKWKNIEQALKHRAFHPESAAHQNFLKETLKKLEEIKGQVNVENEIRSLKDSMIS